ncbi:hypothetical protein [Nitrosospira sp. NRS527]|uniref:hypothetical protein n=1 Tax=Nitrosospira sp. NRS527 TaxID=155925 RepID=UPI001AF09C6B|nr:hypothetical protein [Nitrosospira sp. NRS527]BCT68223.1 hypothetical protein NNRS527_01816 [Nitrosospira sp. NRS527]
MLYAKRIFWHVLILLITSSVFAQKQVEYVLDGSQKRENRMGYSCRYETETRFDFQERINKDMGSVGNERWELVLHPRLPYLGKKSAWF